VAEEGAGRQGVTVESMKRRKRRSSRLKNGELFPTGGETNLLYKSAAFQCLAFSQVDPKSTVAVLDYLYRYQTCPQKHRGCS
jgi:hypothetical protein